MSRDAVERLFDKWTNDGSLRETMRRDPEGAIRGAGIALDEDELAALRNVDWSANDEGCPCG